jgi:hypothetical protein
LSTMLLNSNHFSNGYFPVYPSMYPALNRLTAMRNPLCAPNVSSEGSFAPGRMTGLAFGIS